jgi:hypothetical protein
MLTESHLWAEISSIWTEPAAGKGKARMENPLFAREIEQAISRHLTNSYLATALRRPETCSVRSCRRARSCIGPYFFTDVFENKIKAQQMLGLRGIAYQSLPACFISLKPDMLATFEQLHARTTAILGDDLSREVKSILKDRPK